jgi:aspartyl-tRNA(Asn)/glutamyl-tRNA(Gln) amidotransferase subunit B
VHDGDQDIPTPIVEVKNMNSFRAVERALAYEADRQFHEFQRTGHKLGDVPKQTRGWDETGEMTVPQRSKEEASDYRYFPEPDLAPVVVDEAWLAQVKASIGEPPADRRYRFQIEYEIPAYDADVIINQGPALADYFETVAHACSDGKMASNWIMQDVLRILNEQKTTIESFPVPAASLGELLESVKSGRISTAIARDVFAEMLQSGKAPAAIIAERGLEQISDSSDLDPVIDQVLADQQQALRDLDNPKKQKQVIGYLTGQVMRATGGKANPTLVRQLLEKRLTHL